LCVKRFLAILLFALLIFPSFACAEEPVFAFRNGLHWGMSPAEVLAAEGRDEAGDEFSTYRMYGMTLEDLALSKFEAEITYLFVDGKLAGLECDPDLWFEFDDEDIEYLKQALTIVYGPVDETLPVPAYVAALMEMGQLKIVCGWQPAEDTYICVIGYDSYIKLGYFDVNVDYVTVMQAVAPTPTTEPIHIIGL